MNRSVRTPLIGLVAAVALLVGLAWWFRYDVVECPSLCVVHDRWTGEVFRRPLPIRQ